MKILQVRLKKARLRAGYKQVEVSRLTGVNNKTLSGYENGVSEPDANTLKVLAELYEVSVDWLLAREDESQYAHPEDEFMQFIRAMEEKYNVELHDDPILVSSLRALVEMMAKEKHQQNTRLHA